MRLEELTNEYGQHKVFMYAADGNRVVRHNKMMRQIAENIYAGEPESDGWGRRCNIYLCFEGVERGIKYEDRSVKTEVEDIVSLIKRNGFDTIDGILVRLNEAIKNSEHIPLPYVEFVKQISPELVPDMMEARKRYEERLEQKRQERAEKRKAEEEEFVNQKNEEFEQKVNAAIDVLKSDGLLTNGNIEVYRSRYDYSVYSIVNYLFRKYGIKLPIRTAGWVNDSLVTLTIENGKCEQLQWYRKSKNSKPSDVIYGYINQLIGKVRA